MTITAYKNFSDLVAGILTMVKAADIYTIHLLSQHRKIDSPTSLIESILKENNLSGFTLAGASYKEEEILMLDQTGELRRLGEQIVLATYTAIEVYLIQKFKEYYWYKILTLPEDFVLSTLNRFSFRNLQEISKHFYEVLKIHIPSFDIQYHSDDKSHFKPKDSWDALNLLADARNQIAHLGVSKVYKVVTPLDSWYPFEFAQGWVGHFNLNIDQMYYDGKDTQLIREYRDRMRKLPEKNKP